MLVGILEARAQAALLLVLGDVQEELQDDDVLAREGALEVADRVVARPPDVLGDEPP